MPEGGEAADALRAAAFGETQSVGCAGWPVARVGVRIRIGIGLGLGLGLELGLGLGSAVGLGVRVGVMDRVRVGSLRRWACGLQPRRCRRR